MVIMEQSNIHVSIKFVSQTAQSAYYVLKMLYADRPFWTQIWWQRRMLDCSISYYQQILLTTLQFTVLRICPFLPCLTLSNQLMKVRLRQTKSGKAGRAIVADISETLMLRCLDGNKCQKDVEQPYRVKEKKGNINYKIYSDDEKRMICRCRQNKKISRGKPRRKG
jgi:hypothetical protein